MPRTIRFALVLCAFALFVAACSSDDGAATTTTQAAAATTTQAAPTTSSTTTVQAADPESATQPENDGVSALTFTGEECVLSGPSEVGSFVQFDLRNEAPSDVVMMFVKVTDISLEDLVSDVERFPLIDQWPPTVGHKDTETVTHKVVESGEDLSHAVSFNEPGQHGAFCYPLDEGAPIPGALLTVVE